MKQSAEAYFRDGVQGCMKQSAEAYFRDDAQGCMKQSARHILEMAYRTA